MIFDMILFYFGARLGTHIVDLGKGTFSETPGGPLNNVGWINLNLQS